MAAELKTADAARHPGGSASGAPTRVVGHGNDSGRILAERARALARSQGRAEEDADSLQIVTFPIGAERYGIESECVQEVQPLTERIWSPVPCTPDFIVGAVNIRGSIVSIMDIGRYFGLPSRAISKTSYVLSLRGRSADGDDMALGILADGRPDVRRLRADEIGRDPASVSGRLQEYVMGVTGDMLIVLNIRRLLADPGIIVQEDA